MMTTSGVTSPPLVPIRSYSIIPGTKMKDSVMHSFEYMSDMRQTREQPNPVHVY